MLHIGEHFGEVDWFVTEIGFHRDNFGCRPWRMVGTKLVVGTIAN
jgi:hypothetical protein